MPDSAKVSVMGGRPLRLAALLGAIGLAMALAPVSAAGQAIAPGQFKGTSEQGLRVSFSMVGDVGENFQVRRRSCESDSCAFVRVGSFTFGKPCFCLSVDYGASFMALGTDGVTYRFELAPVAGGGLRAKVVTASIPRGSGLVNLITRQRFSMKLQDQAEAGAAAARNAGSPARAAAGALAAATATRTEYVAQLDSICQSYDQPAGELIARFARDTRGLLKEQIHGDVADTEGRLLRAFGRLLAGGTGLLGQMSARISAIPPPLGDEATVAAWLQGRASYERIARSGARAARQENAKRLFVLLDKAGKALAEGDQKVASFGFQQCA